MTIQTVSILVGTVLPILVAVVTTKATHPRVKAILLALLAAASGFGSEYLTAINSAQHFDWGSVALTSVATFITGVAVHLGLLKPAGVSGWVQGNIGRTRTEPEAVTALRSRTGAS